LLKLAFKKIEELAFTGKVENWLLLKIGELAFTEKIIELAFTEKIIELAFTEKIIELAFKICVIIDGKNWFKIRVIIK